MILYLISIGVVAAAATGVFFGVGFLLLLQPVEAVGTNANAVEEAADVKSRPSGAPSNGSSSSGDLASALIEPQIQRSAENAARDQPVGVTASSSAADNGSSTAVAPPTSTVNSLTTVPVTEPAPALAAVEPVPQSPSSLAAGQIANLLARGDAFLRAGDVASARLFYERAADAGDQHAAMRMGATFDPAFLGRAGLRTYGEPVKAQFWYRHALDLNASRTHRQAESPTRN
jgi:hypothetical protein